MSANLVVTVLLGAVFLAAFATLAGPRALAGPGDPVVSGKVTDNVTTLPIPSVLIRVEGNDVPYLNETYTDAAGDYAMKLPMGNFLFASAHGSYYLYLEVSVTITGDLTKDVALDPAPPRDATVKGYVTDSTTALPIATGQMVAMTPTFDMPIYVNLSSLDALGYYEIGIIPGDYRVESEAAGYQVNSTTFVVASGEVYWANMSLDPLAPETSLIQGFVSEGGTGQPIVGAFVFVEFTASSNSTLTNVTGYYAMNVSAGDALLRASASGFGTEERSLTIGDGEIRWENFTLVATNAMVKGYITDLNTGTGIDGAGVFVGDMASYMNFTSTDSTGYYEMRTIAGALILAAFQTGYLSNMTFFSIADGEVRWINLTLRPEDAVLKGFIDEFGTGAPVGGVSVDVSVPPFSSNATFSDGAGYYEVGFVSGAAQLTAFSPGYESFAVDLDLTPGENWFNFTLYPQLPESAMVLGYVYGPGPLASALVRVYGYGPWFNETFTDGTGFYSMNTVPADLTLLARASGHAPNRTDFSIAAGETLWINVTLDVDTTAPNIVALGAVPFVNVSANNPTSLTATIDETWLDRTALSVLKFRNASPGVRNYTLLATFPETDYGLVESSPGMWNLDFTWDARIPAGWIGNASGREWVPLFLAFVGPWDLVAGQYRNASNPTPTTAFAFFSGTTGELELLSIGGPPEAPDDPTGEFRTVFLVWSLDDFDNVMGPPSQPTGTWFSVLDVDLVRDDLVGSGNYGFWLQTWDYGDNYGQGWTFLDVDNTPPVADAGSDRAVLRTATVVFDGTGSTDNVGIANYTWTFDDGGIVTLYGAMPSQTFSTAGDFEVTLRVTDGASNTDSDVFWVNVTLDSEPPVANAGPDQVVDEDTVVTFDGSGSTDNVAVANYTWALTDVTPQTLYGIAPSYVFANPGSYAVTLTVTDLDSNTDTDIVSITVSDITVPTAVAGPNQVVDEDTVVSFDGSASSDNVGVANYTWAFDDGGPKTLYGVAPTYTFAEPGSYVVTLSVRDAAGNPDADSTTITVLDVTSPIANAGPDQSLDEDTVVTFDGSASSDNVGVANYTWTFDDGGLRTLYGMAPSYTFAEPGSYVVTLTVRDATGNVGTDTLVVWVVDATQPTADAGADRTVLEDVEVDFDGSASSDNVGVVNHTWDFGDGTFGYGATPKHTFADPNVYAVTLTVRDAAGNEDTDSLTVTVQRDTDGDGTADVVDPDDDGDGMPDDWEVDNGLDPLDPSDATGDPDGDGLTNLDEYLGGTDPNVSNRMDLLIWIILAAVAIAAIAGVLVWRRRKSSPSPSTEPESETVDSEPEDDR